MARRWRAAAHAFEQLQRVFDQRFFVPTHQVGQRIRHPALRFHARQIQQIEPALAAVHHVIKAHARPLGVNLANRARFVDDRALGGACLELAEMQRTPADHQRVFVVQRLVHLCRDFHMRQNAGLAEVGHLRANPERQAGRAEIANLLIEQRGHAGRQHERRTIEAQRRESRPLRAFENHDMHEAG